MEKGFIRLSRKFFTHELWLQARTYSACEAWLFLIKEARFEATPRTESIGGREITWKRGQYPASIRFLARHWQWSERGVRTFLEKLKKKKMITTDCTQGMNVITLCQYETYNSKGNTYPTGRKEQDKEGSETDDNKEYDGSKDTNIHHEISILRKMMTQLETQSHAQIPTHSGHTGDTITKKEKEPQEKEEKRTHSRSCTSGNAGKTTLSFSSLKPLLLADDKWKLHASQHVSVPTEKFAKELPEKIDQFLHWIQAIGEESTVSSLRDAKRRFIYWFDSQKRLQIERPANEWTSENVSFPEVKKKEDFSFTENSEKDYSIHSF